MLFEERYGVITGQLYILFSLYSTFIHFLSAFLCVLFCTLYKGILTMGLEPTDIFLALFIVYEVRGISWGLDLSDSAPPLPSAPPPPSPHLLPPIHPLPHSHLSMVFEKKIIE